MHENSEKQITITGVAAPFLVALLTKAYAHPAPNPPYKPINEGTSTMFCGVGLIIKSAPAKAIIVAITSVFEGFSFRSGMDKIIAKNGESLFSIFASANASLSIA